MSNYQLLTSFINKSDRMINKWIDYFEVYEKTFSAYKNKPITFLEIGVQNGGSLQMWREFFGPEAKIIGVDIDPQCKSLEAEGFEIWIGNQADPNFWAEFKVKNPKIDLVLDDGGHTMEQQIVTFKSMFVKIHIPATFRHMEGD
jgi:cephalosporin hydroxylase